MSRKRTISFGVICGFEYKVLKNYFHYISTKRESISKREFMIKILVKNFSYDREINAENLLYNFINNQFYSY